MKGTETSVAHTSVIPTGPREVEPSMYSRTNISIVTQGTIHSHNIFGSPSNTASPINDCSHWSCNNLDEAIIKSIEHPWGFLISNCN